MANEYEPIGYCPRCGYRIDPGQCPECGAVVARPQPRPPRSICAKLARAAWLVIGLAVAALGVRFAAPWLAREYWPTGHLCQLANENGRWSNWAVSVLSYRLAKRTNEEQPRFSAREANLTVELAGLGVQRDSLGTAKGPSWAGRYGWLGGDNAATLTIAPNSGFAFYWSSVPSGEYVNHGSIAQASGSSIRLSPAIDLRLPHRLRMAGEYVPIKWGAWRFMVPVEEMVRFCNDVREDPEYAPYNGYLSNRVGEDPPGEPLPHVPAKWQGFLTPPEVQASVTRIERVRGAPNGSSCLLRLHLDKGEGLLPGMRLFGETAESQAIDIESITDSAAMAFYDYNRYRPPFKQPAVGTVFRTRRPDGSGESAHGVKTRE